jgi:hypothetical protein
VANRAQTQRLLAWAEPFGMERTWAIESANGLGRLFAQQLLGAGEEVVDVPPTLSARVRLLGSTKAGENDSNDALSTAIAGLRHCALRGVNDVPRHLCTVSRDITSEPERGIEPLTLSLRVKCSAD